MFGLGGQVRLTRKPGAEIYASVGLANPWAETRIDPNGYYHRLGLSRNKPWLMSDIRAAYRQKSRELHPDNGGGDAVEFNRVTVAYSVLSDPKNRREYDELKDGAFWPDDEVILKALKIVRVVPTSRVKQETHLVEEAEEVVTNWMEYGYDDDPPNLTAKERQVWIDLLIKAHWDMGYRHEVIRIGFCSISPHLVARSWGDIFMLSGTPSEEVARNLISQSKRIPKISEENETSATPIG